MSATTVMQCGATPLTAPFPWFGGKSRAAHLVWDRFGDVANYVEPFAGSLAVLLARPHAPRVETVNDLDAYLANFWRALRSDPEAVTYWADWPVNEADLHARHRWLTDQVEFRERMRADPEYFDAKIAGWWVWGISMWIGSGWCSKPEWQGRGNVGRAGRGLNRNWQQKPRNRLAGILHTKRPVLRGTQARVGAVALRSEGQSSVTAWLESLAERLRYVRVMCGDWARCVTPSVTTKVGGKTLVCGVLLDPPYDMRTVRGAEGKNAALYAHHGNDVSAAVREWAIANGDNPLMRIALCGYEGEHEMPGDWECVHWKAIGGYANQRGDTQGKDNSKRERIWFSPHCLTQQGLFDGAQS